MVDIVEIGAGGGSIAWIDAGGALKIGPRSAGASPGPASYGLGGVEPTVTDANLIAARINPDYFLGGELKLDLEKAKFAYQPIADALGVSVEQAAIGVIRVANANMINALKLVSVRRGYDPREFALIAFGGGGSMHAVALASELRIGKVIIPVAPGHFSAFGMLMSNAMQDYLLTALTSSEEASRERVESTFARPGNASIDFFLGAGFDRNRIELVRSLDMRYNGQEHTVRVRVSEPEIDFAALNDRFHAAHEKAYTFRLPSGVEIVNYPPRCGRPDRQTIAGRARVGFGEAQSESDPRGGFRRLGRAGQRRLRAFRSLSRVQVPRSSHHRGARGIDRRSSRRVGNRSTRSANICPEDWRRGMTRHHPRPVYDRDHQRRPQRHRRRNVRLPPAHQQEPDHL